METRCIQSKEKSLICEFCQNNFTCTSALYRHQRTTKKCISIRENVINIKKFDCEHCNKSFTSKQRLDYHIKKSCKVAATFNSLENKVKILQDEIKILKENSITSIPSTVNSHNNSAVNNSHNTTNNTNSNNNNTINIISYMTPELVRQTLKDHYTVDTLTGGEAAFADFTMEHFLNGINKPTYICTDRSRQKFSYFDGEKQLEDPNADILADLASFGLVEVMQKHYETALKELDEKIEEYVNSKDHLKYLNDKKDSLQANYFKLKKLKKEGEDYRYRLSKKLPKSKEEHENLLKVRQEIEERKELERKTLESIKDELEILSDLRVRHHKATGMCFNSYGEVVGKYCWNLDGYHDYSELTAEDKKLCANKNFKILERC